MGTGIHLRLNISTRNHNHSKITMQHGLSDTIEAFLPTFQYGKRFDMYERYVRSHRIPRDVANKNEFNINQNKIAT